MIIKPNEVDSSGLNINAKNILEFPPIYTGELSYWGEEWTGNYKKSENLINDNNINDYPKFKQFLNKKQEDFDYGFISFLELY